MLQAIYLTAYLRKFAIAILGLVIGGQVIFAQAIPTLEYGKPIDQVISGTEVYSYKIELLTNQYAKIIVKQNGVDIRLRSLDSKNTPIIAADYDRTIRGFEVFEVVAKNADTFRIDIGKEDVKSKGNFVIEVVELRTATADDLVLDEVRILGTRSQSTLNRGRPDEALPMALRSLELIEKAGSTDDSRLANALFILAQIYKAKAQYSQSESVYLRAIKLQENAKGNDDSVLTMMMMSVALLYQDLGDFIQAEDYGLKALKIREKILEPGHLLIGNAYNTLGTWSQSRGDNSKAIFYYRKSLGIKENALDPNDQSIAVTLNNIASLTKDISLAEPLFFRSLAIKEKQYGKESKEVGSLLDNLSWAYLAAGDYSKAEGYAKRSLAILEKTLGVNHPNIASVYNLLGRIHLKTKEYSQAEKEFRQSISVREKISPFYFLLVGTYSNLSRIYALNGEKDKAIACQAKANEIGEFNLSLNLRIGSEREKLALSEEMGTMLSNSLTLHFNHSPDSQVSRDLAHQILLRGKGRILDVGSNQLSVLRNRFDEKDRELLDRLSEKNSVISNFITQGTGKLSTDEYKAKINSLSDERETIEAEITRRASAFYEKSKPVEIENVKSLIPNEAILLDFAVYTPNPLQAVEISAEKLNRNSRYAVFVMKKNGEVKSKDLGEAQLIDEAILKFREALQDPKRTNVSKLAQVLQETMIAPLREFLGDATQLLISPDGQLNLIPFEALIDRDGKYLLEKYSISYLSSGRDLLRLQNSKVNNNTSLIIANPKFDDTEAPQIAGQPLITKRDKRRVTVAKSLTETYFSPLNATELEGKAIQSFFPSATLLIGEKATESALKQTKSPKILHLATHGFFIADDKNNAESENPLLRSGLAFSGANIRTDKNNDGILTALEASGLNLFGTQLVVLSACGTGLGEVQSGEGVFGLRRSFLLAGSQSLVMSLWSVSDVVTRELMTNYYKGLQQSLGRGEALRQAQLKMLKRKSREHPFYWASFIQSGEWANLDGKR
jgi:CHAT domain-containing protein/Tfp pilus assembly protein PilF